MAQHSKDLFDDATMTFGEHLEVLRVHLFKALIGLVFGVVFALFFGTQIIAIIRKPIDDALAYHAQLTGEELNVDDDLETVQETDWWAYFLEQMGFRKPPANGNPSDDTPERRARPARMARATRLRPNWSRSWNWGLRKSKSRSAPRICSRPCTSPIRRISLPRPRICPHGKSV